MSINITDELHAATIKGKIASAKEVFLTGDTENLQQIGEKTHQLEDSIKNIAATGGASTAAAVTFNNAASGMTAINIQGAIEELNTKNNEQDNELGKKFAKANIVQELGDNEDKVVSQKCITNTVSQLEQEQIQGGVYDVSAHNNDAVFESLQTLLSSSNLSTLIPPSVRHGGMMIRFIQGSEQNSGNKYVQYRLMANAFSTKEVDWQGIDNEPTTESENLVKSGGVKNAIKDTLPKSTLEEGIYICNNEGKAIIRLDILDNMGGFGSHLINVINTLIENVTNEISLRVGNVESKLLRTANITNTPEDGFYITDENGHALIRLDVLDSANGFGDNLYQFILNLINDKAALIKSTASDTLFITDERGNACAYYKDGKWEMPLSSKYNIDRFRSRSMVFGVEIDRYDYSVKRIADSVGLQSNYKIGTNFVNDGNNDFDSIFPWCDIKLCNVKIDENGNKTITYQDEEGFARDGSNGDVMVEIPKFYTFRKVEGTKEYVCISGEHKSGFVLEPAFTDDVTGEEIDYIYVGAYLTKIINNKNTSISNVTPTQRYFLNYREAGNMFDFVTYQAIRKLFLVEFATIDSSTIFGGLSYLPFWYYVYATEDSDGAVNEADFYSMENKPELGGYNIDYLFVGANITVNNQMNIAEDRKVISLGEPEEFTLSDANHTVVHKRHVVFSGDPVVIKGNPTGKTSYDEDYDTNITLLYAIRQDNGLTDAIDYHSGRAGLTTNNVADQFKYRNIEGLWGNIGQYIDGVKVKNLEYYVSSKRSEYGDISKYTKLSYATPRKAQGEADTYMWQTAIIKTMGYDRQNPTVMLPDAITSDGSGEIHLSYGDVHNANASQDVEYVLYSSMAWDGGYGNGLFVDRFWDTANYTQLEDVGGLVGSRMCIRTK